MPEVTEHSKTILVADDEQSIRTYVSILLTRGGYRVLVAESGKDALQKSREYRGTIHLLLSNVQMPGITGIELGTKLNLERPDLRVMLMSGYASGMLILNDGWHFLHKPFLPTQLLDLISGVLKPTPEPKIAPDLDEHP